MEFITADKLADAADAHRQISRVFVDGFYWQLKTLEKDKTLLYAAFDGVFDLAKFHVAVADGEIAAMFGIHDGVSKPIAISASDLRKTLGAITGRIAYWSLNRYTVNKVFPVDIPPNYGVIDFVAANPAFAGKGIAKALMANAMEKSAYRGFILEVLGNNENAIKLYEKLGFVEVKRVRAPLLAGSKFVLYMKYDKPEETA